MLPRKAGRDAGPHRFARVKRVRETGSVFTNAEHEVGGIDPVLDPGPGIARANRSVTHYALLSVIEELGRGQRNPQ